MPDRKAFRVFIASPSDLTEERRALEEVIAEINRISASLGTIYELIKWETHTRPSLGADAQDVINSQIKDEYEVFVGVMWTRFGTPTNRSGSGTEEEFTRAVSRWHKDKSSVEIMFYFKDAPISPSKIDVEQFSKVGAFRKKISEDFGAFYHQFEGLEDFKNKLRIHLSTLLNELARGEKAEKSDDKPVALSSPALKNFLALQDEDEDDDDVFEITEGGTAAMDQVSSIGNKLAALTGILGDKVSARGAEIKRFTSLGLPVSPADQKQVANGIAADMEEYTGALLVLIPEFKAQYSLSMEAFSKLIMLSNGEPQKPEKEMSGALEALNVLEVTMAKSSEQLSELQRVLIDLPKSTKVFNKARRRLVAILSDLLAQIHEAVSATKGVELLLVNALKKLN